MTEIWKDILGYDTHYEISNYGNIRSKERIQKSSRGNGVCTIKAKNKKVFLNKKGYVTVVLSLKGKLKTFTVHQLVAQAFLPNFIKGETINHIDGDKTNNHIDNLEKSNPSHNMLHAHRIGLVPKQSKSKYFNVFYIKNPRAIKKWAGAIRYNGKSSYGWKTFHTEEEAGRYVDYLLDSIGDTQRNRNFPKLP